MLTGRLDRPCTEKNEVGILGFCSSGVHERLYLRLRKYNYSISCRLWLLTTVGPRFAGNLALN